jgi:hypothetical protein
VYRVGYFMNDVGWTMPMRITSLASNLRIQSTLLLYVYIIHNVIPNSCIERKRLIRFHPKLNAI